MSFAAYEESRTLGVPTELFSFVVGPVAFYYTDSEDDYVYQGVTYSAIAISRSNVTGSGALDRATVTISIDEACPLAAYLRQYPRSDVMAVTIRQGQRLDPEAQFLVAWAGRALSSKHADDGSRQVTCQPIATSLRRVGLRRNWQYGCPHVLYGDRCRADQTAASLLRQVTKTSANAVRTTPFWTSIALTKYQGGLLYYGAEVRTILRVLDAGAGVSILTLSGPVPFEGTQPCFIVLGCDHTTNDCQNLHKPRDEADYGGGNIHNFGGQPYIPSTNPTGLVNNFG